MKGVNWTLGYCRAYQVTEVGWKELSLKSLNSHITLHDLTMKINK